MSQYNHTECEQCDVPTNQHGYCSCCGEDADSNGTLKSQLEHAIKNDSRASNLDRIETRRCSSDNFDGVQYNIYGGFVPIRPVVDVVAETGGHAIESLHFTNDVEEPCLGVFVAEIPEQPHPAFVNGRY